MSPAAPIAVSNSVTYQGAASPPSPGSAAGLSFGDIMSDLNPLQYLPVVGTIYRAITGDTIPRPLREAGSLLVSGSMGGPAGVATNLAMLGFEKLTGIDLEAVEQRVFTALLPATAPNLGATLLQAAAVEGAGSPSPAGSIAPAATATAPTQAPLAKDAAAGAAWTPAQLAAYGVVKDLDGNLRQGNLSGAEVLNALQLRSTPPNTGA